MKKLLLSFVIAASMLSASAQTVVTVTGEITAATTWTNDKQYLLSGFVYVKGNTELTIQPGTVIKGDKASKGTLIITRGSKLIANGTERAPIIFTSNEAAGNRTYGDWGGIIILGAAPINIAGGEGTIEGGVNNAAGDGKYGGTNANDNSGSLKYVRVEYPGIAFQPNNEINGITFGGVGAGTTLDHIQVSYSGDDAVEFFGGNVNAKHVFTFRSLDDNFDFDNGYSGMIQYGVSLVDPAVADVSKSNGIECDNDATGTNNGPITRPNMQNMTILGPNAATGTNSLYASAAHFRRATKLAVNNSIIMGYPTGLYVESDSTNDYLIGNRGSEFKKNLVHANSAPVKSKSSTTTADSTAIRVYFAANGDTIYASANDIMLEDAFNLASPNFMPKSGSPANNGADFTGADAFFDKVNYRGAFGPIATAKNVDDNNNWLAGWSNTTPNATDYSKYMPIADFTFSKAVDTVTFINNSIRGTSYTWNFGDDSTSTEANPVHKYDTLGDYTVTLTASNGTDNNVYTMNVKVDSTTFTSGIKSFTNVVNSLSVYPNPVTENATVKFNVANTTVLSINVYNIQGQLVAELANNRVFTTGINTLSLNTENITSGLYMVTFVGKEGVLTHKVLVQK